jgi:hypothetical protein
MKVENSKNLLAAVLIAVLLFSTNTAWASAAIGKPDVQPATVITTSSYFLATSSSQARAGVIGTSSGFTPFIKLKITACAQPLFVHFMKILKVFLKRIRLTP